MITKQSISREIIFLLFLITSLYLHLIYISIIRIHIGKDDCVFDANNLFIAITALDMIGNIFLTISFILTGALLFYYDELTSFEKEDKIINVRCLQYVSFLFLFTCSILSNITFFKGNYLNNMDNCSNSYSEHIYNTFTFSFAWILFLFYISIAVSIISLFVKVVGIAIKESNLCDCLKISFKRVTPVENIRINENDKNIQTEFDVSIPISSLKNEIKPFVCIICMEKMIDIILKPCNHICVCGDCVKKIVKKNCPCCNIGITEINNIYIANLYEEFELQTIE